MRATEPRPRPFETTSSAIVWSCPWYQIRQDAIVLPNGAAGVYNTIEKPDAVWILPVTADLMVPMLYTYRYTIDKWCWEIPAGGVEDGRTLEETARDELLQEVGGVAESLEYIAPYYLANGICNERGHFFLATGVRLGTPHHEPAEVIEVHVKTVQEVIDMAYAHQVDDGPSALAILLCAERLRALVA